MRPLPPSELKLSARRNKRRTGFVPAGVQANPPHLACLPKAAGNRKNE
jgi:hypothetical protein